MYTSILLTYRQSYIMQTVVYNIVHRCTKRIGIDIRLNFTDKCSSYLYDKINKNT